LRFRKKRGAATLTTPFRLVGVPGIALMITMTAMALMLGAVALHHCAHHLAVHFFAAFVFAPLLLLLLLLLHMLGVLFRRMLRMVDRGGRRCLGRGYGHSYEKTGH
jgi:hypothetical protein